MPIDWTTNTAQLQTKLVRAAAWTAIPHGLSSTIVAACAQKKRVCLAQGGHSGFGTLGEDDNENKTAAPDHKCLGGASLDGAS